MSPQQLKVYDLVKQRKEQTAKLERELRALETLGSYLSCREYERVESTIKAKETSP